MAGSGLEQLVCQFLCPAKGEQARAVWLEAACTARPPRPTRFLLAPARPRSMAADLGGANDRQYGHSEHSVGVRGA